MRKSVYLRRLLKVEVFTLKKHTEYESFRLGIQVNSAKRNDLVKPGRKIAAKQIGLSIIIVFICALITYFYWGFSYTKSSVIGGLIAIIPNVLFAYKAFKYAGARSSKKVLESFYGGEKMKLVLTAVLFALAFRFLVIEPVPFFGTFCLVMVLPLLTPFFIKL